MSFVWVSLLTALCSAVLVAGLLKTERAYQFPFLACALIASWVLPQLPGIFADPSVPRDALAKTLLMTLLCLIGTLSGWHASRAPAKFLRSGFDERRLGHVAIVLALAGAGFYYRLSQIPGELSIGVQISGVQVIYLFFSRLMTYGLVISCLLYVRRPSWSMLAVIGLCLVFYLERILVTGKRAETMELVLIFLLPIWFYRRRKVGRTTLIFAAVAGMIVMTSMSAYRDITRAESKVDLSKVAQIDAVGNLDSLIASGGDEMRNAVTLIDATDREGRFDFGTVHWNVVVWNFLPAQIVGATVKQSMMLDAPPLPRDFNPSTGTTYTGMTDAFRSFWYLGALEFFLLGYVMRRFWESAMEGQLLGQIVYILSAVPATHAFSHVTDWVLPVWIHMLIFLAPALAYAHRSQGPGGAALTRGQGSPAQLPRTPRTAG
jgi:hypothetical protein